MTHSNIETDAEVYADEIAREDNIVDAKDRSKRTLLQGAVAAVIVAVLVTVAAFVQEGVDTENVFLLETWFGFGAAVTTAAITALASYIQKRLELKSL